MQLQKLSLTNFRAFKQAEFEFQPGMNLIVGINGVGKSTILDAVRIMLSQTLPKFTASKSPQIPFEISDITADESMFLVSLEFQAHGINFSYDAYKPREQYGSESRREIPEEEFSYPLNRKKRINLRREKFTSFTQHERYEFLPNEKKLPKGLKTNKEQPLAVFFSTRRSTADGRAPSKASSAGRQAAAFSESLSERELRWQEIAEWWRVQEELGNETPGKRKHLKVLSNTASLFLDDCTNLRVDYEELPEKLDKKGNPVKQKPTSRMLIDKNNVSLDVRQLSDGERGMLSLVLDLAKRLSLANPDLKNPLYDGKAIVLIDELDLHLHPRWQRDVVKKLTSTFQNCQFIVTTHSPQIIGEVKDSLVFLERNENNVVVSQSNLLSYGFDSSWILQHLMGTESRSLETQEQIKKIELSIEEGDLEKGREQLETLRGLLPRDDDEVKRLEASINNLEALADEVDSDEADK